ncbi:MAG TPA: hypothetical protein VNM92_05150 [Thermoanaerobaculia bacterium]|nr:hypothetical protein [Thermoanaerobaculia bacterium]
MKKILLFIIAASSAISADAGTGRIKRHRQAVPNSYIVVLKPTARAAIELIAEDIERFAGGKARRQLGKTSDLAR